MITQRRQISASDLAFSSGEAVSQELPTLYGVVGYHLHVEGQIVAAGGTTSSAARSSARQWEFVDQVRLLVNGGRTLKTWKGEELRAYYLMAYGTEPPASMLSGNLDAGTHTFELDYFIPGRVLRGDLTPNNARVTALGHATWEELTTFQAWSYDDVTLEVTWGTAADLSDQTGDRTETLTVGTVELYEEYPRTESLTPAQQNALNYASALVSRKEFTVTAAEDEFAMELPRVKGRAITRIFLKQVSDGSIGDGIINSISVKGNESVDLWSKQTWNALQAINKRDYRLSSALDAGWAVVDFMEDKNMGDILQTDQWRKLHLVADVAHPGTTDRIHLVIESVQAPVPA